MDAPALRTVKAHWDLSNEGYVQPNRTRLLDLAWRLAAILQPGFAPERTRRPVSSTSDSDEYGGSLSTAVSRLGDAERGLEITDTVSDAHDGMTPFEAGMAITVYGLPDGCALALTGSFIAPLYGRPNPAGLEGRMPEAAAGRVAALLQEEFGATVETE